MKDRRKHLDSGLAAESLVDRGTVSATEGSIRALLPDVWLVLVSGALIDRGRDVLVPLVDRIGELKSKHKIALSAGSGVRERHTFQIGLDLGLPIGGLAAIAGAVTEQNALILWALMSPIGGIRLAKEEMGLLSFALDLGEIPILPAQPPYHYWEYPRAEGVLPPHGSDCGTLMLAENLGCRCVFLKDVDGVFDADPAEHPEAKLIPRASVDELMSNGPATLPVERAVLGILRNARRVRSVHIVSGLDPQNLDRVFAGESVGTLLEATGAR